ncbi:hypothetical protein ACN4EK_21785 [Pantanalinema rosaneae CENA516]|uniref:hypothetical protein n=1 Tax=Pantanalinema rosaneae TaxID=1620701 RepID=UPI003D6F3E75
MSYQERLNPWVINKLLPNLKHLAVIRFRRRNDAEAYLKVLKETQPHAQFMIAFEANQSEYASQGE